LEQEAEVVPCPICRKTFLVKDIEVTAWYIYVSCNHFAFHDLWSHQLFTGFGFCLHVNLNCFHFSVAGTCIRVQWILWRDSTRWAEYIWIEQQPWDGRAELTVSSGSVTIM
jgi:hypothetical protein